MRVGGPDGPAATIPHWTTPPGTAIPHWTTPRSQVRRVNSDLDQRRRPWRRGRSAVPVELLDRPDREGTAPEERLELVAELRRLPPMQRRTIVLRYWLGMSVEETARELSVGEGTVKSHSSRGLATLRERLGEGALSG